MKYVSITLCQTLHTMLLRQLLLLSDAVNEKVRNLIIFTANQIANNSCIGNAYHPHK